MKKLIQEEAGENRRNWGNFAIIAIAKFCYNSEIFASVAKFRYIAKISPVAKPYAPCFCVQTTPFRLISILPSL